MLGSSQELISQEFLWWVNKVLTLFSVCSLSPSSFLTCFTGLSGLLICCSYFFSQCCSLNASWTSIQVCCVSFALVASWNNRDLPYCSQLASCPLGYGISCCIPLLCLPPCCWWCILQNVFKSLTERCVEITLMGLLLLSSPFALPQKYKDNFSSF